jgi:Fe-S cluster assembly protein SufD
MTTQVHQSYFKTVEEWMNNSTTLFNENMQRKALSNFVDAGIPTTKWEDWKYTNISKALLPELKRTTNKSFDKATISKNLFAKDYRVIFVNGLLSIEDSLLPNGINIEVLDSSKLNEEDIKCLDLSIRKTKESFSSLNFSCALELIKITIDKDIIVEGPITLLHITNEHAKDGLVSPKIIIKASKFSKATFVEHFVTQEDDSLNYTMNHHCTCIVEDNAKLRHIKVQNESHEALHIGKVHAEVARDGDFHSFSFSVGAKLSRNNIEVNLNGENATTHVDGLYTLRGDQHNDNFSAINHLKPHTYSGQLYKGILDQNSRGVFTGKIVVHRDAQKVDSTQLNKNLLLSKKAHVDTRPQLQVYADDVKCAHGATVGQISEEEVFYLESRGIQKTRAQKILCHAFAGECLDKIEDQSTRLKLGQLLFDKFEKFALEELGKN